ncbi:uncharacterized protein LOC115426401 isoform X4 [Sphaeramia orbicularis]|uniref:uncharacterized protein LOC115426401 isoform X4 n=1 Tax=Sphaeramia orbicularis TaxID=375764 RepID=UPI00117FABC9|nr:uncharacterized protein LOC115426401 isoform X4 [Sphaeramia orbicularis]
MAFSNLFASLSAVSEDVRTSCQPALKQMDKAENGQRGRGRKRKNPNEQTGSCRKRQHFSNQTAGIYNAKEGMKAEDYQRHMTNNEFKTDSFRRQVEKNNRDTPKVNNMGQKDQTKNNQYVNKQHQQKKMKRKQRNLSQQTNGRNEHRQTRQTARKGGPGGRSENIKKEFPKKRFMTQEFKEQNALEVDGRLLCQHFLWGRCIKGDLCQLEHVQGYNGLIKEVCKFYVQGFCLKGDSCPYMHKSFPCKFFHKHGRCNRGDCKFSHEPLTDVTEKLLDEAIKRSNDLIELVKKAEQESAGQSENTQGSEITETNTTADWFIQPVRPNFYSSSEVNTEKETGQRKDLLHPTEDDSPPHLADDDQPHESPPKEPVCYSVEAVLGPQLFKPFRGLFTTPSSDFASGSPNQSEAPYSVSAVLKSFKSGDSESFSLSCEPPFGQTVLSTLKTEPKQVSDPILCSEKKCEPVHFQEKTYKSLLSKKVNTNMCPGLTVGSGDKEQCGALAESLKPAQRPTSDVKSQMHVSASAEIEGGVKEGPVSEGGSSFNQRKDKNFLSFDAAGTADCNDESLPSNSFTQTSTPKPHLSDSSSSIKPFCPSSIFRESKCRDVSTRTTDAENCLSNLPTEIHQNPNHGVKQHHPTELSCRNSRSSKTPTAAFRSLFATPITSTLQPGPRDLDQSGFPAPSEPEDNRDKNTTPNPSATSFISLFATPLRESATSLPHLQSQSSFSRTSSCFREANQRSDPRAPHSSDPKLRSPVEPLPDRTTARISHQTRSPNPKKKNEDGPAELIIQPKRQVVNSAHTLTSDSCSETSKSRTPQTQIQFSSDKGKAVLTRSVLRSLFLHLSPYQQDGPQQGSIPSECEKTDKSNADCVFEEQQKKNQRKAKRKKSKSCTMSQSQRKNNGFTVHLG